jgi:hypothetical protein
MTIITVIIIMVTLPEIIPQGTDMPARAHVRLPIAADVTAVSEQYPHQAEHLRRVPHKTVAALFNPADKAPERHPEW